MPHLPNDAHHWMRKMEALLMCAPLYNICSWVHFQIRIHLVMLLLELWLLHHWVAFQPISVRACFTVNNDSLLLPWHFPHIVFSFCSGCDLHFLPKHVHFWDPEPVSLPKRRKAFVIMHTSSEQMNLASSEKLAKTNFWRPLILSPLGFTDYCLHLSWPELFPAIFVFILNKEKQ